MQWFYVLNGASAGPVSQEQFDQLVQAGTIKGDTLVWRAGMGAWQAWAQVSGALSQDADTAVCAVSGRVYPRREMLEYQGRWVSAEHKDVFFQRIREGMPVGDATERQYGGFWIRVVAAIIDGICVWVLSIIPAVVFTFLSAGMLDGGRLHGTANVGAYLLLQLAQMLVLWGIAIAYNVFFIRKYDATPGKMALGLKVLRSNGEKLSIGRIIGRYFAKGVSGLILCIGYMMAGWDAEKRALHDHMCDTRVVRK